MGQRAYAMKFKVMLNVSPNFYFVIILLRYFLFPFLILFLLLLLLLQLLPSRCLLTFLLRYFTPWSKFLLEKMKIASADQEKFHSLRKLKDLLSCLKKLIIFFLFMLFIFIFLLSLFTLLLSFPLLSFQIAVHSHYRNGH